MFRFVIRKMLSKKWMALSLLIGNILLISIASSNPMYTQAVLQRALNQSLQGYLDSHNVHPGRISVGFPSFNGTVEMYREFDGQVSGMAQAYGLEALETVRYVCTSEKDAVLDHMRDDAQDMKLALSMLSGLDDHAALVAGRMYADEPDQDGVIEAVVSERLLMTTPVLLDDVMTFPEILGAQGEPLRIRIVGVFTNASSEDAYWVKSPGNYSRDCFISPDIYRTHFLSGDAFPCSMGANWYVLLDYTAVRSEQAQAMLEVSQGYQDMFNQNSRRLYVDTFTDILEDHVALSRKVNVTLWVLQIPIFVLLAAFIFMVSRQMLEMEQNEIAVIKSRGASRGQIFAIYLIQSVVVSALAYAAGIPLGVFLCRVLGSSTAFLEFVRRSALPVEVNAQALIFAGIASVLSVLTMVLPAMRYARTTIVNHKQKKNRSQTPLWQKLWLDVILLAVALYGLYSFGGQKELLAARVQDGASLDPLLFLSSSLFMIGAGLLAVRITPLIVWTVFRLFRRLWSPALYASFLRVLRTRASQGFIMVFLIMTIALGIFNAQAARTINQNAEDNLHYTLGADVVLREEWNSNAAIVAEDPSVELVYQEPDFGRYENLEGAAATAKVYVGSVSATTNSASIKNIRLMGINTKDFGETAWFKDTLSDIHWYHYLNAVSQNSRAILVSRNFQTDHGCKLGDAVNYRTSTGASQRGVIYGFVDYFPSFVPVSYQQGVNGLYEEANNYLIVASLQQLQADWGVMPYEIWLRHESGSDYLYDFIEQYSPKLVSFKDADSLLVQAKRDPVLQGTNGILTVGFIVVLTLCSVGFLIYWILSIQSRSLQFGIFRAMGMSMREVFTMLLNEQLFISGLSIAAGALVGHLTAKLYMPLIQLGYAASDNALPLEVVSLQADNIRLFAVIGLVMLVCMVILGALISHMKIAQALKLGED